MGSGSQQVPIARTLESTVKIGQHMLFNHTCSRSIAKRGCGDRVSSLGGEWRRADPGGGEEPSGGELVVVCFESGLGERMRVIQVPGDIVL